MVRLGVVRFHRTCSFHPTCPPCCVPCALCPAVCPVAAAAPSRCYSLVFCFRKRSFGLPPSSLQLCTAPQLPVPCACCVPCRGSFAPEGASSALRLVSCFGKSSLGLPASSAACLGASRVCAVTSAPADCLRLCTGVCAVASAPADCLGSCALPRNCPPVSPLALSSAGTGVAPR